MSRSTMSILGAVVLSGCVAGPSVSAVESASVGPLTVHVYGRRVTQPRVLAGVHVLVYAPGGGLVDRTVTDAAGNATVRAHNGGAITVVEREAGFLTTFYDVAPGDELSVGDVGFFGPGLTHATLTVPALLPGENAKVEGPCTLSSAFTEPTIDVLVFEGCPATRPIVASRSLVDPPYPLTGYVFDPEVTLVPGGTATLDGDWTPPVSFDLALSNIPSDGLDFSLVRTLGTDRIYQFFTGTSFPVGGTLVKSFPQAFAGDGTTTHISFAFPGLPGGTNTILEHVTTASTSLISDVSTDFIARPVDHTVTMGSHGPTGGTWRLLGPDDADGIVARLFVNDAEFIPTLWTAILPPHTDHYTLPRLPDDLRAVWEDKTLDWLYLFNVDTPAASYSEFRRDAETEFLWEWMRAPTAPGKVRIGA